MQLPVDVDLALGNVARQVGDGVRDVVVDRMAVAKCAKSKTASKRKARLLFP